MNLLRLASVVLATTGAVLFGMVYKSVQQIVPPSDVIEEVAENVWSHQHYFKMFGVMNLSSRMTIIRNGNEIMLINPVFVSDALKKNIGQLGTVKYVIVSNGEHHKFFG
jgi:hypothetical protein